MTYENRTAVRDKPGLRGEALEERALLPVDFASNRGPLFSGLDIMAWLLAAVMTIGPLFAAFVGRMTS